METENPDQHPVDAQTSRAAERAETARVEPSHIPRSGAHGWMLRGLFEAGLILLGLLGAFALNQWQDARIRADRADAMLSAIRAELQANLALQQKASEYNTQLVADLKKLRDSGQSFVPAELYRGGLLRRPQLTAAAWTAAQEGEVLDEIPLDRILVLARVYESQRYYLDATGALFASLYESALRNENYSREGTYGAAQLAGVLSDFAGRGAGLLQQYQFALKQLDLE
jgi:hypothetical protein